MPELHDVETEFVPKSLFELQIQNLRDKSTSDEKLNDERIRSVERLVDERLDTMLALMEKNLAEYKAIAAKTDGRIDVISARLDHAIDSLTNAINNSEKRTNSRIDAISANLENAINSSEQRTNSRIDAISANLENAIDSLTIAIDGNEKRLDDFKQEIQEKQSSAFARWSILTAILVGAIQVVMSIILHFWH